MEKLNSYFYLVLDIVKSSSPLIPLNIQRDKVVAVTQFVTKVIKEDHEELNSNNDLMLGNQFIVGVNFTGDGFFLIFKDRNAALDFARYLNRKIQEYNLELSNQKKELNDNIPANKNQMLDIKIAISYGEAIDFTVPNWNLEKKDKSKRKIFWGPSLINAHRMIEDAKSGHILCANQLKVDWKQGDIGKFKYMGLRIFKHDVDIPLYSFYGTDSKGISFGNNKMIKTEVVNFEKIPIQGDLRQPFLRFFELHNIDLIEKIKNINDGQRQYFTNQEVMRLFESLFLSADSYLHISGNPARFVLFRSQYLRYHKNMINRTIGGSYLKTRNISEINPTHSINNCRIIVFAAKRIAKNDFSTGKYDDPINANTARRFFRRLIKWHEENKVDLHIIEPDLCSAIREGINSEYGLNNHQDLWTNTLGIFPDLCCVQFGKYIADEEENEGKKIGSRLIQISDSSQDTYEAAIKFFKTLREEMEKYWQIKSKESKWLDYSKKHRIKNTFLAKLEDENFSIK